MKITRIVVMALIVSLCGVPVFAAEKNVPVTDVKDFPAAYAAGVLPVMKTTVTGPVLMGLVDETKLTYSPFMQDIDTFINAMTASEGLTQGAADMKVMLIAVNGKISEINKAAMDNMKMSSPGMTGVDNTLTMYTPMVFETAQFSGYKTIEFISGEKAICTTDTNLLTAKIGPKQVAACVAHVGKFSNEEHYVFYKAFSIDSSSNISVVRMPNLISRSNLNGFFEENHVSEAARIGLKNGAEYQSAVAYTDGKVITTDKKIPDNYRGSAKKKSK